MILQSTGRLSHRFPIINTRDLCRIFSSLPSSTFSTLVILTRADPCKLRCSKFPFSSLGCACRSILAACRWRLPSDFLVPVKCSCRSRWNYEILGVCSWLRNSIHISGASLLDSSHSWFLDLLKAQSPCPQCFFNITRICVGSSELCLLLPLVLCTKFYVFFLLYV